MTFGQKLRQLRNKAGYSQEALANLLDITQSYLSHLEQGRRLPSADLVNKLDEHLKLEKSDLAELRRLVTEAGDKEGRQAPQIRPESVEDERNRQRDVSEVWVIARSPLESYDDEYRKLVIEGISSEENPRKYIYWTSSAENFDFMISQLSSELVQTLRIQKDSRRPDEILSRTITCIVTPEPAVWFSFVIYNPTDLYAKPSAYLSIEEPEAHTGFVMNITRSGALVRSVEDLKRALLALSVESPASQNYRDRGWCLHYPNNSGGIR